ncbi:MAG: T9SS type A sorting domain-containing protein [Bacteroidetes bacterium]|nr:T9SS type A sorting domain-containing protein [Bacteroidota bacterium]
MNNRVLLRALLVLSLVAPLCFGALMAQQAPIIPRFVPPDISTEGFEAHYRDMAVIETDCRNVEEATLLSEELIRSGALIAIVSSPQRMLGWVPRDVVAEVRATALQSADRRIGVRCIAYSVEELDAAESGNVFSKREYNEADQTLRDYLAWVRLPMTPERELAREQAEQRFQLLKDELPNDAPVEYDMATSNAVGGDTEVMISSHATSGHGHVDHTSFFLESRIGTGLWNWQTSVYNDYKIFYVNGIAFWASQAAKYGRWMTTHWRLYGRNHSACQLDGEAVNLGKATFIPIVIDRVTTGSAPSIGGLSLMSRWVIKYNRDMRSATGHKESICGFIAYKGTAGEGIWPHASLVGWNDGKIEGMYFALDNQYWQAVPDPLANPMRNVIAHEMGHLWGAPDEYYSTQASCDYTYRGISNDNCQRTQTVGSYNMRGFDGIMQLNYTGGSSRATPVHTGVISASAAAPRRLFRSLPAGARLTLRNCDAGSLERTTGTYVPISHDYCMTLEAQVTRFHSGYTWYFDEWEVRRQNSGSIRYQMYGPTLPSTALLSSRTDPIVEVIAHYTNSPPDFMTSNTTLEAWRSHYGHAMQPAPNVALRWRSNYNMNEAKTIIEYDRSGSWVPLGTNCIVLYHPNTVPVGQWTGLRVHSVPLAGGTLEPIQPNRQYRFRIVGEYNTIRGYPSVIASVRTAPANPVDSVFCYDPNVPNSESSPKVLPSMGPGIDSYTIRGAITIDAASGEFSWYRPNPDYYRITAIGLSSSFFGDKLRLRLKVRDGSDFRPNFQAQRAGTSTWIDAGYNVSSKEWILTLSNDGEYVIRVNAVITNIGGMHDLADRLTRRFGFGEYTLGVGIEHSNPTIEPILPKYVRLLFPRPYPGLFIMDPPPPPELILASRKGFDKSKTLRFSLYYISPPGQKFESLEGELFGGKQNPMPIEITPNTPPGEYLLYPNLTKFPDNTCELVIINPEGPGGPIEERISKPYGTLVNAEATVPTGYVFVGWGGDTVAISNPLPVVMWRHKKIIAYFREKPCIPEDMPKWEHTLSITHAQQTGVRLTYGMQEGAGDGLEAGQVDLPPVPPPGTFDVRWINIPGSQGSITDIRAIKPGHVYQGRVQIGSGMAPAVMTWSPPGLSPSFTWLLKVASSPEINMHAASEYIFPDEGVYMFTITVKEPDCPPPTEESDIIVDIERIEPKEFPCIELELLLKSRKSGDPLAFMNPYSLKFYESTQDGGKQPAHITHMSQMDSTLLVRLCSSRDDDDPDREISIIPDEDDPNKIKDTVDVNIPPFIPDNTENMFRYVHQNSGDWEMVSLPVRMTSGMLSSLYPSPDTKLFRFDVTTGMYTGVEEMVLGEGYWLKTDTKSTLFVGNEVTSNTLSGLSGVGEPSGYGWNMVGGISHSVAVTAIGQNPTGSLIAIFGWNPGSGYVIPSSIDPGYGYWFRCGPGSTFTLAASGVAPSGGVTTRYEKTAAAIPVAGVLKVRGSLGGGQHLTLAARELREKECDALSLPIAPPVPLFDVRSGNGTLFVSPGSNELLLQHEGALTLIMHPRKGMVDEVLLRDETGVILHRFHGGMSGSVTLEVDGMRRLRLDYGTVEKPLSFMLQRNYPNPFVAGGQTVMQYSLDRDAVMRLDVYDLFGRRVVTLADGFRQAGHYTMTWNGTNDRGALLPAGVYMYRLETEGRVLTRRCSILR